MKFIVTILAVLLCVGCTRSPSVEVAVNTNAANVDRVNENVNTATAAPPENTVNADTTQEQTEPSTEEPTQETTQQTSTEEPNETADATEPTEEKTRTTTEEDTEHVQEEDVKTITIELQVTPPGDSTTYTVSVPSGSTVEEAMQQAKEKGLTYTTRGYASMGMYVTAVNGLKEDRHAGMYWILYYNGSRATAGMTQQTLTKGDAIRWNYEHEF